MGILLLCATGLLAFANGASDNSKGVASLLGNRTVDWLLALEVGLLWFASWRFREATE